MEGFRPLTTPSNHRLQRTVTSSEHTSCFRNGLPDSLPHSLIPEDGLDDQAVNTARPSTPVLNFVRVVEALSSGRAIGWSRPPDQIASDLVAGAVAGSGSHAPSNSKLSAGVQVSS